MDSLTQQEQRELQSRLEKKQMKDFMARCFDSCINDFTSKSLLPKEEGCTLRCVDKYFKGTERLQARFQELNAQMMQQNALPGR
ncbi:MAG: protein transporter tim9 [Bogoriella megaspora]|nr:MAG: protein transporter tim9 [Bogoriella megaspora]